MAAHANETRLVLFDVDGTITATRSIWQYVLEEVGQWEGPGEENLRRFLAGEIDYAEFCDLDAELLKGESYAKLSDIAAQIPLNKGATELFAAFKSHDYHIALVSTGLRVLTNSLEQRLPVDLCVANDLEAHDGLCTGRAIIEVDEAGKGSHARMITEHFGATWVVAIGDGLSDSDMFREANFSIAVGPVDPRVIAAADVHVPELDLSLIAPVVFPSAQNAGYAAR